MLPRIDLPDLLFEVHSWTGFLDAFGHVSERRTRMEGLPASLVALLVSRRCNIGLTPVIDPTIKALPRSRLSHVDQNHVRADTIAAANAALITAQSRIGLAQMWGGGLLASVDGLRFVVPVKSINTGPRATTSRTRTVARLSPLKDRHINFLGRYLFNIRATRPWPEPAPLPRPGRRRGR